MMVYICTCSQQSVCAHTRHCSIVGGYTCALAVGFVLVVFFIVKPAMRLLYNFARKHGDVVDNSLFISVTILMLLVLAFTAEEIGLL